MKQEPKTNLKRIARRLNNVVSDVPLPHEKTIETDRWTEILFRALSNRVAKRWRFVSFRGPKKREFAGIVDVVAIRKNTSKSDHEILKMGDLFEIILVQMKGGSAPLPTAGDRARLRAVSIHYDAKKVVLFEWKRGEGCTFSVLDGDIWVPSTAVEIFG
jgi:hypothetical protein